MPTAANATLINLGTSGGSSPDAALDLGVSVEGILFTTGSGGPVFGARTLNGEAGPGTSVGTLQVFNAGHGSQDPRFARQPGDPTGVALDLDAGDTRISTTPIRIGNKAFFAHTVGSSIGGFHDLIEWVVMDVTNPAAMSIFTSGAIEDVNLDFYYPSLAVRPDGTFLISFNGSGPNTNISSFYVLCDNFGGTCSGPTLLDGGSVGNYFQTNGGTENRWGDYSATALDPSDPNTFWAFSEIPLNSSQWTTVISRIDTVPEPATFGLMAASIFAIAWRRFRRA